MSSITVQAVRLPTGVFQAEPAPRLSLRLAGAVLGVGGIVAAALQSAGFIPHPGLELSLIRAVEQDLGPAVFGPTAEPAPAPA
ncbi:MAG: hypothetical protein H2042_11135, partial [Rhizobiales bacterium]|nr:hypothetical protein [Hyphomicrobiales bacterium]